VSIVTSLFTSGFKDDKVTSVGGTLWLKQIEGQAYASDRGRELEPNNLKGTKLGSPSWESGPESGPHGELRVEFSRCSGLLIHRSGYSHICSGLEVEMEFGEVKIRV
jgi:hypothetical protein